MIYTPSMSSLWAKAWGSTRVSWLVTALRKQVPQDGLAWSVSVYGLGELFSLRTFPLWMLIAMAEAVTRFSDKVEAGGLG